MAKEIVLGLHFYQPPREAFHSSLKNISTDPNKIDWTALISHDCYEPLATEGLLYRISYDIYQSLLLQMERLDPRLASIYAKSLRNNGVGDAFIHPILPDLSKDDKNIVVSAGVRRFTSVTGEKPQIFWPPETAVDIETLEVLKDNGYSGFVCAPEQILQADGSPSDNQPTEIHLPSGRFIIAFPFDREISTQLAFNPKKNADDFAHNIIKPRADSLRKNQVLVAWTDAETFGHHCQFGDRFLEYLTKTSLPEMGLYPISINGTGKIGERLPVGRIVERSAWSCPHHNLIRWNGECNCSQGHVSRWTAPFYQAMARLNEQVSQIVKDELGQGSSTLIASSFYEHYSHPETINNPQKALISAKISSLVSRTSCATFFADPNVSGKINLLYSYQSLLFLHDAGLIKQADQLKETFIGDLSHIVYPNGEGTALNSLEKMLTN